MQKLMHNIIHKICPLREQFHRHVPSDCQDTDQSCIGISKGLKIVAENQCVFWAI